MESLRVIWGCESSGKETHKVIYELLSSPLTCIQIHSEASITPITKRKIIQHKKITGQYRWWTQVQKSSTKYQQTESNNTLKESYKMIKWDLSQGYKNFSNLQINMIHYINKFKNKNHNYLSRYRKSFWQILTSIYDFKKPAQKVGIEGTYLNIIKAIYDKPTVKIIFNSQKLKLFL